MKLKPWKVSDDNDFTDVWLIERDHDKGPCVILDSDDGFDREAAEMVCNALNAWDRAREARARLERREHGKAVPHAD